MPLPTTGSARPPSALTRDPNRTTTAWSFPTPSAARCTNPTSSTATSTRSWSAQVCPRTRSHNLRHSAAVLFGLGVHPKVVSELLGHSQIGIILDLYSHVTVTMQQQAVTALDDLFGDLEP
jgi:site-specific recombinase XerD